MLVNADTNLKYAVLKNKDFQTTKNMNEKETFELAQEDAARLVSGRALILRGAVGSITTSFSDLPYDALLIGIPSLAVGLFQYFIDKNSLMNAFLSPVIGTLFLLLATHITCKLKNYTRFHKKSMGIRIDFTAPYAKRQAQGSHKEKNPHTGPVDEETKKPMIETEADNDSIGNVAKVHDARRSTLS